jgi:predicted SnoaL-like aldol condensation-catalyzing enzyme
MKTIKIIFQHSIILAMILITGACNHESKRIAELKTQLDSVTLQRALLEAKFQQLEENKNRVAAMYQELFGDKNADAVNTYLAKDYIQHNPIAADGREALENMLRIWFKDAPKEKIDIQHIGADGDFVYIHTKSKMGDKIFSVIDIFRLENDTIVEHWDVIQEVPKQSANSHPMF